MDFLDGHDGGENWGQSPHPRQRAGAAPVDSRVSGCARRSGGAAARAAARSRAFLAAHREWIESRRASRLAQPARAAAVSAARPSNCGVRRSAGACTWRAVPGRLRVREAGAARAFCARRAATPRRDCAPACAPGCCAPRATRLEPRVAALAAGHGRALFAGFHPPAAFALGKLFGARYHQPQLLPAVPAPRSGGLPHRARAHAREAHESLGAFLAGGGTALRRTGARSIASSCRAGATCRAGFSPNE